MERPKIYVKWVDHQGVQHGWTSLDDVITDLPVVETLGFLIKETEDCLVISHSKGAGDHEGEFFDAFLIVKAAIIHRELIK